MSLKVTLTGSVFDGRSGGVLSGLIVRLFVGDSVRPAASSATDNTGSFSITVDAQSLLKANAVVVFGLSHAGESGVFYRTDKVPVGKWPKKGMRIAVPDTILAKAYGKPAIRLLADGEPAKTIEVGQTLMIAGTRLRPSASYTAILRIGKTTLAETSVSTDQFGSISPTVLAPQLGLAAFDSDETYLLPEAIERLGGQTISVELVHGKTFAASTKITVARRISRPLGFVSDKRGHLQNAIQFDRDPLHLTVAGLPKAESYRIFIVPRQGDWRPNDPIVPAHDRRGRSLALEVEVREGQGTLTLAEAGTLTPGAYDLIVRPLRYGFERDEELFLLDTDVVVGRHITGLVVREEFWTAKIVLGGCVNAFNMSGTTVSGRPYFKYRDTFVVGENVWAALDPGIVMPGQIGKKAAFYVVNSKTAAQWGSSTALSHVPPVGPLQVTLQSGCINANKALVWPGANTPGTYDIVADFGNNAPNPANFLPDGSYDTPLDMIDGYFAPGFRIVKDPGIMTEFANVGGFEIASQLAGLGIGPTLTVEDENGSYATPGGYTPVNVTFARDADIRFPADVAGATSPSQLSVAQASYPLVVVVHGNGHHYLNYGFLLDHLAKNGFIAMSIHIPTGPHGLSRANAFFDHLNTIRLIFGTKLQNNVSVLGHSRGGEAVFKIARLNNSGAMGIGLKALMSLAPTDQYGKEALTGAASVPLFVLYGAKDGDVAGWPPYSGYNVRHSGFGLYDRFDDKDKSMGFVYESTHNGFVTHNEISVALSVADQQKVLVAYANAFFRMHARNEPQWAGMFTGKWKPPSVGATPAQIHFQYRDTSRRTIDNFEGAHTATSWQTSTIGTVSQTGLSAGPTEAQLYPNDNQSPHDTGGLRLTWNSVGDELTFTIPVGQRNVTSFQAISLRVGQVANSVSNPAAPQNFRVALRDGSGNERAIRVGAFGSVPVPAGANTPGNVKSAMATIRIPLSAYTVVCAGAAIVKLNDVTTVKVQFSEPANVTGEIAIDELEFTA